MKRVERPQSAKPQGFPEEVYDVADRELLDDVAGLDGGRHFLQKFGVICLIFTFEQNRGAETVRSVCPRRPCPLARADCSA
jgi:hypothetical protein